MKSLLHGIVSVVIPTYQERQTIESLLHQIFRVLHDAGIEGEVVVVDDASTDGTSTMVRELACRYPIQWVSRPEKLGLASAVMAGIQKARGDTVIVMDADLSHPPEVIPIMLQTLASKQLDMVVGSRYVKGGRVTGWPWYRRFLSRLGCKLAWPLAPVADTLSGFFAARKSVIEKVSLSPFGFKVCLELIVRGKIRNIAEVPYVFCDRRFGESKFRVDVGLHYLLQLVRLYQYAWRG